MILSEQQRRSINGTAALMAKMARTGLTPAGQPIWSEAEIAALRSAWPDRRLARKLLPSRTVKAIEHKTARLGLTRKRTVWSAADVDGLRPRYPTHESVGSIAASFDKTKKQTWTKGHHVRLRRPPRRPLPARDPMMCAVRQRAFALGISLEGLDRDVRRQGRFQNRKSPRDLLAIQRALAMLGGRFVVTFD